MSVCYDQDDCAEELDQDQCEVEYYEEQYDEFCEEQQEEEQYDELINTDEENFHGDQQLSDGLDDITNLSDDQSVSEQCESVPWDSTPNTTTWTDVAFDSDSDDGYDPPPKFFLMKIPSLHSKIASPLQSTIFHSSSPFYINNVDREIAEEKEMDRLRRAQHRREEKEMFDRAFDEYEREELEREREEFERELEEIERRKQEVEREREQERETERQRLAQQRQEERDIFIREWEEYEKEQFESFKRELIQMVTHRQMDISFTSMVVPLSLAHAYDSEGSTGVPERLQMSGSVTSLTVSLSLAFAYDPVVIRVSPERMSLWLQKVQALKDEISHVRSVFIDHMWTRYQALEAVLEQQQKDWAAHTTLGMQRYREQQKLLAQQFLEQHQKLLLQQQQQLKRQQLRVHPPPPPITLPISHTASPQQEQQHLEFASQTTVTAPSPPQHVPSSPSTQSPSPHPSPTPPQSSSTTLQPSPITPPSSSSSLSPNLQISSAYLETSLLLHDILNDSLQHSIHCSRCQEFFRRWDRGKLDKVLNWTEHSQ